MSEQIAADQKSAWRSWLVDRADGDESVTGFDAAGWDDTTWVLHFMYESPDDDSALTHDDLHRDAVNQGLIPATIVGSVNLDEVTTVVGNALGMSARPSGWTRLRWRAVGGASVDQPR